MAEQADVLLVEVHEGVAVMTINRPEVMNAINLELRDKVIDTAQALDRDKAVRAVVLTGAGDRAFCTGADLKERREKSTEDMYDLRRYISPRWVHAIAGMTKPTIAAVRGYCMAGGVELMLQCDMAIAADDAVFAIPEVTLGFLPGAGACQRLPRLVGISKAKELILTGRRFGAQEAERMGLVTRLVPSSDVLPEAMALAKRIAANPAMSVVQAKIALNASQETALSAGLRFENEAWLSCMLSEEWRAKLARFGGK